MNKFFSFMVAVVAIGVMNVHAQRVEVGIKGGLAIPNLTSGGSGSDTPLSEGYSSITAFGGGAFADFKITQTFSLQTGLEYSHQGGQKKGVQALPAAPVYAGAVAENPQFAAMQDYLPADFLYADFKSVANFYYLMLPVQAKLGWNLSQQSPFRFYVSTGVFASYLLSAERLSKGTFPPFYADASKSTLTDWVMANNPALSMMPKAVQQMIVEGIQQFASAQQQVDDKQDIKSDIRHGNYGFIGAAGLSYQVDARGKIFIEAGGNYGLVKLQKETINGQNRIGAASIMLGYAFSL
jgi:hypothetical protein